MKKITLLITSILVIACNRNDGYSSVNERNPNYQDSYYTNTENRSDSDWQITLRIKKEVMADSSLSASARLVSVTTNDGIVTLNGTVASQREASYLIKKVKSLPGVRGVTNELTISA